jgi:enoyl-CoA hydratase/carnithine racemase
LTVTFTRDEKLNAIDESMTAALWRAIEQLRDDSDVRVLVIQAEGRYFTAGIDLKDPQPGTIAQGGLEFRRLYRRHHLLYDEFEAVEKPIILAAQGPCLGAGVEMACSCDFRFAASAARFQLPEVKLGVLPGSGGISRLTSLVGPHWTKWLAMANQSVDANEALTMGFLHGVFAAEQLHVEVQDFARSLIALPGEAVGAAKLTVDMCAGADRETARNIERVANTHLCLSGDLRANTDAFVSKSQ